MALRWTTRSARKTRWRADTALVRCVLQLKTLDNRYDFPQARIGNFLKLSPLARICSRLLRGWLNSGQLQTGPVHNFVQKAVTILV